MASLISRDIRLDSALLHSAKAKTMLLSPLETDTRDCTLVGALIEDSAQTLRVYDDYWGELHLYGDEHGPSMLIRTSGESSAYEIAIDESPTIDARDVHEAYGFYIHRDGSWRNPVGPWILHDEVTDKKYPLFSDERACEYALEIARADERDLQEGYQYQSNSSGTGIVCAGHHEWLSTLKDYNSSTCHKIVPIWTED